MKPDNDNDEPTPVIGKPGPAGYHVIVDETRDGRIVAVRAPLPAARPAMHFHAAPGDELTPAEREALERFFAHQRARERAAGRRAA